MLFSLLLRSPVIQRLSRFCDVTRQKMLIRGRNFNSLSPGRILSHPRILSLTTRSQNIRADHTSADRSAAEILHEIDIQRDSPSRFSSTQCETLISALVKAKYSDLYPKHRGLLHGNRTLAHRQLVVNDQIDKEMADIINHQGFQALIQHVAEYIEDFSPRETVEIHNNLSDLGIDFNSSIVQKLYFRSKECLPYMDIQGLSSFSRILVRNEDIEDGDVVSAMWGTFLKIHKSATSPEEIPDVINVMYFFRCSRLKSHPNTPRFSE